MWTKASHKYQTKFGFVRKTNAYFSAEQINKHQQALQVENELYKFALSYLNKTYGRTHIDRDIPEKLEKRYLVNKIKAMFIAEKYGLNRWNVKKLSLSSHNAQLFLVQLITNFAQYQKELRENAKNMDDKDRFNFKMNITHDKEGKHHNSKHKSWYRIGGLGFNADNRTILIDLQPKTPLQVISMHKIKIPDYGLIYIQGNAYNLCQSDDIQQVKLKWQHDNTYQLQIVHVGIKPDFDINNQDSIGLDWNMTNNEFYHSSNDDSFYIPDKVVKRADQYECKINKLKSKRDRFHKNVKALNKKIGRYSSKRTQLLVETYRRMVPEVVGNHKVIVIERLGTKDMRKPGKSSGKNRGFNRKLALVKPYMLQVILANYAWKHAVRVIKVDSFKTSQVEFGTMHIHKHPLNQRSYLSDVHPGKVIKRDLNAAKNILDWGLHPDHHIKVRLYPKVTPRIVADFM